MLMLRLKIKFMSNLSHFQQFAPKVSEKFKEGNNAVINTRVSSADRDNNISLSSQKNIVRILQGKEG
jgi:hypothetical protein